MIWVLAFVFIYMVTAAWDIGRVNGLYAKLANPGPRKRAPELPPAPRLAINLPPNSERPSSS